MPFLGRGIRWVFYYSTEERKNEARDMREAGWWQIRG